MDTPPEAGFTIGITIAEVLKAVLVGIGSITLWLLKKLGDTHVATLDTLVRGQRDILHEVSGLHARISVLESKVKTHLHEDDKD
jgi:hypothetical protein